VRGAAAPAIGEGRHDHGAGGAAGDADRGAGRPSCAVGAAAGQGLLALLEAAALGRPVRPSPHRCGPRGGVRSVVRANSTAPTARRSSGSRTWDKTLISDPDTCCGCGGSPAVAPVFDERRHQVFDVPPPPPRPEVTEYRIVSRTCVGCGTTTVGQIPAWARGPVQYDRLADGLPQSQSPLRAASGKLPGLPRTGGCSLLLQTLPQPHHIGTRSYEPCSASITFWPPRAASRICSSMPCSQTACRKSGTPSVSGARLPVIWSRRSAYSWATL
jgi:hypothetical protein